MAVELDGVGGFGIMILDDEPRSEVSRIDSHMADVQGITSDVRARIWSSATSILGDEAAAGSAAPTVIAVGYVQSGKTTSFTSLIAQAADDGYQVVIAMLGSTNLLLAQNRDRLIEALDLERRHDYVWLHYDNPDVSTVSPRELAHYISRGRRILVTLLKHHGRIENAARLFTDSSIAGLRTLIVDDEADQVSLNTRVRSGEESATYAAIRQLRAGLDRHLYVQYTATPYAPLLLEVEDFLSPDSVELLTPGPGYVGGKEFFVDNRDRSIRVVNDAPGPAEEPRRLPTSLEAAFKDFVTGAALLLGRSNTAAPISMLVHPTGRRDPQRRYEFLMDQVIERLRENRNVSAELQDTRRELVGLGCQDIPDSEFDRLAAYVVNEVKVWRVNSDEDAADQVRWNLAPVHVLIGGNKLDRGFTVEGLTVTWLGRPQSVQADTMMQRARAFGYRSAQLPYCRIYAAPDSVAALTASVEAEMDMRAQIRQWLEEGLPVAQWASAAGIELAPGYQPTRRNVISRLDEFRAGWHFLSRPDLDTTTTDANMALLREIGLLQAEFVDFGRIRHRVLELPRVEAEKTFLQDWNVSYSPGWDPNGLRGWLRRSRLDALPVVWMTADDESPRTRAWDAQLGFEQLMQGRDARQAENSYPGDRLIMGDQPHLQVHYVRPSDGSGVPALALAFQAAGGSRRIVRRGTT